MTRLIVFASGDFACNLYWPSSAFYLLFFYTDVLRLSPGIAGVIPMVTRTSAGFLLPFSAIGRGHATLDGAGVTVGTEGLHVPANGRARRSPLRWIGVKPGC